MGTFRGLIRRVIRPVAAALVSLSAISAFVAVMAYAMARLSPLDAILWGGALILWSIGGRFLAKTLFEWYRILIKSE